MLNVNNSMKVTNIKCKTQTLNTNYGNMWKLHVLI